MPSFKKTTNMVICKWLYKKGFRGNRGKNHWKLTFLTMLIQSLYLQILGGL